MTMDYNKTKTYLILKYGSMINAVDVYIESEEADEDAVLMLNFFREFDKRVRGIG